MSIRLRLTLWYAGLLGVILVTFSIIFYLVLTTNLYADVDRVLDHFTQETHRALGHTSPTSWLEHTAVISLADIPVNEFATPGVYIQVLDDQGRIVATSSNLSIHQLPVDPVVIQNGLAGLSVRADLAAGGGERVRILTTPVIVQGRVVGLVQVGYSLHTLDDTMSRVRSLLSGGILLAIALAMVMGLVLADRALRPVSQIVQAAQRIVTAQDLSQRIALQGPRDEISMLAETFNAMLSRLEAAFRSQQQFVADSSHELRTPLTVIRGNVELLRRHEFPAHQAECLDAIQREALRMGAIVDDLLLLAQLEAPRPIKQQLVDLDAVVTEVYRTMQPLATEHRLTLGQVEPLRVRGDSDQLKRLLINLVDNALRHTPTGTEVTIQCLAQAWHGVKHGLPIASGSGSEESEQVIPKPASEGAPSARIYATISVADTGPGIAPEHLPHLFERFYRVDKSRSRKVGGTGLGLAIVKGIAEAHGGWVTVASRQGQGTTFTVWLPPAPDEAG